MPDFNPTTRAEAWEEFGRWFAQYQSRISFDITGGGFNGIPRPIGGHCQEWEDSPVTWPQMRTNLMSWISLFDSLDGEIPGA